MGRPAWAAKTLLIGQVGLGYESIVPGFLQNFALNASVNMEEAVIGNNYLTLLLNKGLEGFFGMSKFLASEFNIGVYEIADKSSKIMYAIDYPGISKSIINKVSEVAAYSYESLSDTVSTVYEIGTSTYESLSNTVSESSKSDLELDFSNDNTAFDFIDLNSELYYSNPFSVNNSELICSIS